MKNIKLEKPWISITKDSEKKGLLKELKRELSSKHPLFKKDVLPIARRIDCDDILFQLTDGSYAIVHLTWTGKRERDMDFPHTEIFKNEQTLYKEIHDE